MHDDDITAIEHTADGSNKLTAAQVRAYLAAGGYEAEADSMIADAVRWANYRYTADRHRYIARTRHDGGTGLNAEDWSWVAGDCTRSEERIKALGRAGRRGGLPLGAPTSEDGRFWH